MYSKFFSSRKLLMARRTVVGFCFLVFFLFVWFRFFVCLVFASNGYTWSIFHYIDPIEHII